MKINDLVKLAHENAVQKGFWDKPRETGTLIALIHSEVSEAIEAKTCAEFVEELADICIRIFDLCGGFEIDLQATVDKLAKLCKEKWEITVDTSTIKTIVNSLKSLRVHHYIDEGNACSIHRSLSAALEVDRKSKNKDDFAIYIGCAFMETVRWSAIKGYDIEKAILDKMEKNSQRPRLHGKEY